MKRAIYIIIALLLASSCIYQFDPEGITSERRIVIEGDILIGGETVISVRSTMPISFDEEFDTSRPVGKAVIEDSKGKFYYDLGTGGADASDFTFDTRTAPEDRMYRLHFKDSKSNKEYVSSWQKVVPAPDINKIYCEYEADEEDVRIRMNVDGHDEQFFRWDYVEDWQYHADYAPKFMFDIDRKYVYELADSDYSHYWCWGNYASMEFGLASTTHQNANRLDGQVIATRSRRNNRFQYIYRMNLSVRGLTKDAYDYLHNMREISDITGSLFAPNPDDMRGNIVCQQDSTEFVIGFISAVKEARKTMYLKPGEHSFFIPTPAPVIDVPQLEEGRTLYDFYMAGNRPVMEVPAGLGTDVGWGPERCVNCLYGGGSKKKPEDWPTSDE